MPPDMLQHYARSINININNINNALKTNSKTETQEYQFPATNQPHNNQPASQLNP